MSVFNLRNISTQFLHVGTSAFRSALKASVEKFSPQTKPIILQNGLKSESEYARNAMTHLQTKAFRERKLSQRQNVT